MNVTRNIISEKLRENQYKEVHSRCLKNKIAEWNEESNFENLWEQVKWSIVESAREVYSSKGMWWNAVRKSVVERKEVLVARN